MIICFYCKTGIAKEVATFKFHLKQSHGVLITKIDKLYCSPISKIFQMCTFTTRYFFYCNKTIPIGN